MNRQHHNHLSVQQIVARTDPYTSRLCLFSALLWLFFALSGGAHAPLLAGPLAQATVPQTHTVQPGETLSQIAEKYSVSTNQLMFYNGISDPNGIFVGQELELPPPSTPQPTADPSQHTVQPGETLSQIAEANDVDLATLMSLNAIGDANDIFVGQVLQLPTTASEQATATATPSTATRERSAGTNTSTPTATRVGTATRTPEPTARPESHTVLAGETLSQIAERYDLDVTTLMAINRISNPHAIYRGQVLELTADEPTPEPPTPTPASTHTRQAATATPTATTKETTHTVQAGETLSQIAEAHDVDMQTLMRLNGISNPNAIYRGQVLSLTAEETDDQLAESEPTATRTPTRRATSTPTEERAAGTPTATLNPLPTVTLSPVELNLVEGPPSDIIASLNATYTVRSGDTLERIALRMGVDLDALRRLNRLDMGSASWLSVGGILLLPATGSELRLMRDEEEYVVQPGDSLGVIAEAYDLSVTQLMQANFLANANAIYPGQSLTIPGKLATTTKTDLRIGPVRRGYYYYTVQEGDTLSTLAERFGSTELAILDYNSLPNEETVYAGLELSIPFGPPPIEGDAPPAPASGTSFVVSVSRQQCWVLQGSQILYSWPCSTGYGEWRTRIGTFSVQSKIENARSRAYQLDMPYWLGIYNVGTYENGIHGLPVRWDNGKKIWEGMIGEPATYGCAMLADDNAAILYKMAYVGMPVHITP